MFDSIVYFLVSPINQSLLLGAVGLYFLRKQKTRRWLGKVLIYSSVTWILLCSQHRFSNTLLYPIETYYAPVKSDDIQWQTAEALWILACYHHPSEALPQVSLFNKCSLERLVQAANMYRVKKLPIIVTGGHINPESSKSHADAAADFLLKLGVAHEDIIVIPSGTNTNEEAKEIVKQTDKSKLAIISSATHGIRIKEAMNKAKLDFVFIPVHYANIHSRTPLINYPSFISISKAERAIYEYFAIIKDLHLL